MPVIGGWNLERELSRGGFGAVWRARDARGRVAALKLLATTGAADEVARFLREVEALRRLGHPGVVQILDAGVDQGRPWLAMELIEGQSLEERLRRSGPLSPPHAVEVATQLCEALEAVHALGLLHRDVKPANLIEERQTGRVVLVDFGLSRHMFDVGRLTRTGEALGTPAYMAPEQINGEREQGPAVDVWGAGATLHALLTGEPPFGTDGPAQIMSRVLTAAPPIASDLAPEVTPALDELIARCLAKRASDRPPTARAVLAALQGPEVLRARPASRGWRAPVAGAGLLVLAAGIGAALVHAQPPPAAPPPPVAPPPPPPIEAGPQTLVLQPGPCAGRDTYVTDYGLRVNDNYGANGDLRVGDERKGSQQGDHRTLIRFDLGRVPPGAQLTAARLELYQCARASAPATVTVEARRLLADWVEGTSTCDQTLDGVAWSGVCNVQNYAAASSHAPELTQPDAAEELIGSAGLEVGRLDWLRIDVTPAVDHWLANPRENYGLRLSHAQEGPPYAGQALIFVSSDSWRAELRPRLVLEWTGPPPLDATAEWSPDDRARAQALLDRGEGRAPDLEALRLAGQACAADPSWATPFLVRAKVALWQTDAGRPPPRPEGASECVRTALTRALDGEEELSLARAVILEVAQGAEDSGRPEFRRFLGSHVKAACPALRDDPALQELVGQAFGRD